MIAAIINIHASLLRLVFSFGQRDAILGNAARFDSESKKLCSVYETGITVDVISTIASMTFDKKIMPQTIIDELQAASDKRYVIKFRARVRLLYCSIAALACVHDTVYMYFELMIISTDHDECPRRAERTQ